MAKKEGIKIKTNVKYEMYNEAGEKVWEDESHNTDCYLHGVLLADRMAGGSDGLITHGHAGSGSGQSGTDDNLATYFDEARTALDSKTQGSGSNANDVVYTFTLGAGVCTGNIEEIGLFASGTQATGDMHFYDDSISKTKAAGDTLIVTWTVTYGQNPA